MADLVFAPYRETFGLGIRPWPESLEITRLTDGTHSTGLLIESPEPISTARTKLAFRFSGNGGAEEPVSAIVTHNEDETRWLCVFTDIDGNWRKLGAGTLSLEWSYDSALAPLQSTNGSSEAQFASLFLVLE